MQDMIRCKKNLLGEKREGAEKVGETLQRDVVLGSVSAYQ